MPVFRFCVGGVLPGVLKEFSRALNADVSRVVVAEADGAGSLGAAALAGSNHVLFAPDRLDLASVSGLRLLAHELVHILQQRRMPSSGPPSVLDDPKLEDEANRLGARAAAVVREKAGSFPNLGREPWRCGAFHRLPRLSGPVQPLIEVGDETYETDVAPLSSWGLTQDQKAVYNFMLGAQDRTFHFRDRAHMLRFIKLEEVKGVSVVNIFKNTDIFQGQRMLPFFEKIETVTPGALQKRNTLWVVPLEVKTSKSTITVNIFCSVKRHLITTFMKNQFTPVDRKENNVVVRDPDLFERKLLAYANHQAAKIKLNRMLIGYHAVEADQGYADAEMRFTTDTKWMPSGGWAVENPIHAFPTSGTGTRPVTQEQYNALVTFLLWFFRTEEHLSEGEKYNRLSRLDGKHKEDTEKEVAKATRTATADLQILKDTYKLEFPVDPSGVKAIAEELEKTFLAKKSAKPKHYRALLQEAATRLHYTLATTGVIPAIQKPLIAAKDKPAGLKAASTAGVSPDVRFKTHKVEVKAVLPNLPQDLVAWAVEGHTSVGADKILLAISNSNKVKTHVKAQIVEAGKTLGDGLREVPDALVAVSTLAVIAFRENVVKLV